MVTISILKLYVIRMLIEQDLRLIKIYFRILCSYWW